MVNTPLTVDSVDCRVDAATARVANLVKLKSRLFDVGRRRRCSGGHLDRSARGRARTSRTGHGGDGSSNGRPPGCASPALAMHDDTAPRPTATSGGHLICTPRCPSTEHIVRGRWQSMSGNGDKRLRNPERGWCDGPLTRRQIEVIDGCVKASLRHNSVAPNR